MNDAATARLGAFTDAAFAFAVTLLVAGASGPVDADTLRRVIASIPAFAIGFTIIAMFWFAHVRWRGLRGAGDWRSLLLSLGLVFAVLVYVVPLRAMAASFAVFMGAGGERFSGSLGELFALYGGGFVGMCALTAGLYRNALRNPLLDRAGRASAAGQGWIWTILAGVGVLSVILANGRATILLAPWTYSLSPLLIGLFVLRWDWANDAVRDQGDGTA